MPEIAILQALLYLAMGIVLPLQFLGLLNLLFGQPAISNVSVIVASAAGIVIAGLLIARTLRFPPLQPSHISPTAKVLLAITSFWYLLLFLYSLVSFPDGFDALYYHIGVVLNWLHRGTMSFDPAWGWQYCLPSNAELPALLALAFGNQHAVGLHNLLSAVVLSMSVYLIAVRISADPNSALMASATVATIPMIMYQAFRLYVDLFGTAFLLGAVALFISRHGSPKLFLFLAGCSAGIAIGTKPVFWIYAAPCFLAATVAILQTRKQSLASTALMLAGVFLTSGFWFIRATVITGNPLYPQRVAIGNHLIFAGFPVPTNPLVRAGLTSFREVLIQPWSESLPPAEGSQDLPVGPDRGTGPLFAAVAIPGLLYLLIRVLRQRQLSSFEFSLLLLTGAVFALWYFALFRIPRFGLPHLALCCALAAPMLECLLMDRRRLPAFICISGVTLSGLFCLAEPIQRMMLHIRQHDFTRSSYYAYPPLIDRLPAGTHILDLSVSNRLNFALAGENLTNYVLPIGSKEPPDYVVKDGPHDQTDEKLQAAGLSLVYEGIPHSLFPKVSTPCRIYRSGTAANALSPVAQVH